MAITVSRKDNWADYLPAAAQAIAAGLVAKQQAPKQELREYIELVKTTGRQPSAPEFARLFPNLARLAPADEVQRLTSLVQTGAETAVDRAQSEVAHVKAQTRAIDESISQGWTQIATNQALSEAQRKLLIEQAKAVEAGIGLKQQEIDALWEQIRMEGKRLGIEEQKLDLARAQLAADDRWRKLLLMAQQAENRAAREHAYELARLTALTNVGMKEIELAVGMSATKAALTAEAQKALNERIKILGDMAVTSANTYEKLAKTDKGLAKRLEPLMSDYLQGLTSLLDQTAKYGAIDPATANDLAANLEKVSATVSEGPLGPDTVRDLNDLIAYALNKPQLRDMSGRQILDEILKEGVRAMFGEGAVDAYEKAQRTSAMFQRVASNTPVLGWFVPPPEQATVPTTPQTPPPALTAITQQTETDQALARLDKALSDLKRLWSSER